MVLFIYFTCYNTEVNSNYIAALYYLSTPFNQITFSLGIISKGDGTLLPGLRSQVSKNSNNLILSWNEYYQNNYTATVHCIKSKIIELTIYLNRVCCLQQKFIYVIRAGNLRVKIAFP
jgi:hypothetical protein